MKIKKSFKSHIIWDFRCINITGLSRSQDPRGRSPHLSKQISADLKLMIVSLEYYELV